ncbi:murein hydrolase activator EnvC family protein [Vibrio casei]|uniref:Peptidase M23 n=1 Tax=Vibrio casei TaxID=673372 RepID=A0A368LFJ9_9VIBR|nr:murein hydrolase activator EnvC [Vibrio casei]RCS68347.1 peptidase M23 [Vibrio casei]SJN22849.1 Periplasmic septal ring factor with murein hydrolase activity EnvC/YibP [Vibrio casei]
MISSKSLAELINQTPLIKSKSAFSFKSPASSICSGIFLCLTVALTAFPTISNAASKDELKGVSAEISRQKNSLSGQQKKLNELQSELKNHEVTISKLGQEIRHTERELRNVQSNLNQLEEQKQQLEITKKQQTETLENLIKAYYITSKSNAMPALLQGGDAEKMDRIGQYFQHLAKARSEAIEALALTQSKLDEKERQLSEEENRQSTLLAQQKSKRDDLQKNQSQRKSTVNKIRGNIRNNESYLAELRRNESRLKAEIAKAAKRNLSPMNGLASYRGKLPWPVNGQILHSFGTSQSGQVTWKGIVINAKQGEAVKAVHSGKVVFAEWLRGYGLVILLDHGKGDMTLYGYNQSLLKKDGDIVRAGETIALAGNTGGQSRTSLYFEIRRNSQAQNPKSWLK